MAAADPEPDRVHRLRLKLARGLGLRPSKAPRPRAKLSVGAGASPAPAPAPPGSRPTSLLIVPGAQLYQRLPYSAPRVVIVNLSGQWLEITNAGPRWIRPGERNREIRFPTPVSVAQARFAAPPGVVQPTQTSGYAHLLYYPA